MSEQQAEPNTWSWQVTTHPCPRCGAIVADGDICINEACGREKGIADD